MDKHPRRADVCGRRLLRPRLRKATSSVTARTVGSACLWILATLGGRAGRRAVNLAKVRLHVDWTVAADRYARRPSRLVALPASSRPGSLMTAGANVGVVSAALVTRRRRACRRHVNNCWLCLALERAARAMSSTLAAAAVAQFGFPNSTFPYRTPRMQRTSAFHLH